MSQRQSIRETVARRLVYAIPLILGVITLNFFIIRLAPGDPTLLLCGDGCTPQYQQQLTVAMGLNQPLYVQYFDYLIQLLHGNLGYSFYYNSPVLPLVLQRLGNSMLLISFAMTFSTIIGISLAIIASRRPFGAVDSMTSILAVIAYSLPVFWLGQILILVFGLDLRILPVQGMTNIRVDSTGLAGMADTFEHLLLPGIALGMAQLAAVERQQRSSLLQVLRLDYITTAKAKGASETRVMVRHALRNAVIPVVTIIGINFGRTIAATTVLEEVFAWPGVGLLLYNSIFERDYPTLMGVLLIVAIFVVTVTLIVDILYRVLDPRIRKV